MSFPKRLLGQKDPEPSDEEINKIFVPLRNAICNFKDSTQMSWTIILPAAQKEALTIILHSRGISGARSFFSKPQLKQYVHDRIPMSAIIGITAPSSPDDYQKSAADLMSQLSSVLIGQGCRPEYVAQALSSFALMVAAQVVDKMYASSILKTTYDELDAIEGRARGV